MCEVIVLFNGYSEKLENNIMKANCSCTLIKASKNIIVDTMTAWDRDKILQGIFLLTIVIIFFLRNFNENFILALIQHGIKPDQIDYVICTHSHADHIGNNNLFLNAEHIIGTCVHYGEIFLDKNLQKGDGPEIYLNS